jgi:DNA-directed RNA polymerase specialized sigma24 family protein
MAMKHHQQTDMGGLCDTFLTTHWSLIEGIQSGQDRDRALIGLLLERYWKPVYCCLRCKGYDNEQAKDLTQGFFHEVVLCRELVQRADPAKGRFRGLLLHALNQYLIDERRREQARKRIPADKLVPFDVTDPTLVQRTAWTLTPEECFTHAWKTTLLEQALRDVEGHCRQDGLDAHWYAFRDRVVQPILEGVPPASIEAICARYHIDSEARASNMIATVKKRFQAALRQRLRCTVSSESQVDEELRDMLGIGAG